MSAEIEPVAPSGRALMPATFDDAWKVAGHLSRTSFVPKAMQGNQASVFAAIVWASEVGVGVIQALNGVHVIEGRTSASPEMMRALIRRAGHRLEVKVFTPDECEIVGIRSDSGEAMTVTYTMAEARGAGLTGKDVWKKYPADMLLARATSRIGRALFSDVIAGLSYGPEELASVGSGHMDEATVEATIDHGETEVPTMVPLVMADGPTMTVTEIIKADLVTEADILDGEIVEPEVLEGQAARDELDDLIHTYGRGRFIAWCKAHKLGSNTQTWNDDTLQDAITYLKGQTP